MKKLEFNDENKDVYSALYEAVIVAPIKGIEEIIKVSTIVEKLKSFGEVKEEKNGFKLYRLEVIPTTIELEDDHFRYIKKIFEETQWATSINIELLSNAAKLLKLVEST